MVHDCTAKKRALHLHHDHTVKVVNVGPANQQIALSLVSIHWQRYAALAFT